MKEMISFTVLSVMPH